MKRGLVLSGGAALGAYQAGVLLALREAGLEFDVISATSIGTINALAWNVPEIIAQLDEVWLDNVRQLKPFDARRLLRGRNPFQFHTALDGLTDRYRAIYPFDNQRAEVLVTVTDHQQHQVRVVSTCDESLSQQERELFLKASTTILHIGSKPVEIQGRKYYDGGYLRNVPLDPLLERELDEIWIVPLTAVRASDNANNSRQAGGNLALAKKALPFAYTHSLFSLAEQMLSPPNMRRGTARKFVISPHQNSRSRNLGLGQALLFSAANVRQLLDCGFEDGADTVEDYLCDRTYRVAI
ncbi:MAG TPA: patatin-like phospholipase family protein [Dongiaceae bacterium]|nr:patatin-like phospholipase family protein [Dongiaceae bacterium]